MFFEAIVSLDDVSAYVYLHIKIFNINLVRMQKCMNTQFKV